MGLDMLSGLGGATGGGFSSSSSAATGDLYEAPRSYVGPTINIGSQSQKDLVGKIWDIASLSSTAYPDASVNAPVATGRSANILALVFIVALVGAFGFLMLRKG